MAYAASRFEPEPNPAQMCEACGIRPAHTYLCEVIDGKQSSAHLCKECLQAHSLKSGFELDPLEKAHCYFCGEPATSSTTNMEWEAKVRQQPRHSTCTRCFRLSSELLLAALRRVSSNLPQNEQLVLLEKLTREIDQQVRDQVRPDVTL